MSRKGKCTVSGEMTAYGAHSGLILAESRNYPGVFKLGACGVGCLCPIIPPRQKESRPCWNRNGLKVSTSAGTPGDVIARLQQVAKRR